MNNRPLFWAVMCFALGEVLYIIAGRGEQIGTAIVVLICVVYLLGKVKLHKSKMVLYLMLFVLGFLRIWHAEKMYMGNVLFGENQYLEITKNYGDYSVTCLNCDSNTFNAAEVNIDGIGVVDNISKGSNGYNLTIKFLESKTEYAYIYRDYKVIIYGVEEGFLIGDKVLFVGRISDFVPTGNPGEFNRRSYYKARGIVGYGNGSKVTLEKCKNEEVHIGVFSKVLYSLKNSLYRIREELSQVLSYICDDESVDVYSGILLGDKSGIPENDMLLYRLSGIAHIFAISGLHIGIVGGLLYKLLRKTGARFLASATIAMVITLMYGMMTGFSFSTIRAIVMLGLSLGGEVLGRKYDMLTGMGLALGILLVVDPFRILDGGLILSFGAVAGVVLSKYIISVLEKNKSFRKLKKKETMWIYTIVSSFVFSVGISLVTTPLVAYMYFQIPLYTLVINMVIIPLMTVTVYCGFVGLLVGLLSPILGGIIIFPGVLSLKLYKTVCEVFQMLPMDVINTGKPRVMELVIYYFVLAVVCLGINPDVVSFIRRKIHSRTKKWIPYMKLRMLSVVIMVCVLLSGVAGTVIIRLSCDCEKLVFLNVGQGDGILIHSGNGTNMVIDVGSTTNDSLGEYVTYPALLAEGMGTVDYWFITHFDKDHTSGLEYVLGTEIDIGIRIKNIVVSKNSKMFMDGTYHTKEESVDEEYHLLEIAKSKGVNIIYMEQGDCITDGSFVMEALHPSNDFCWEDKNEQSLVLSYKSSSVNALFTGDIGMEAISNMLNISDSEAEYYRMDYDVIKVPHHGSKNSLSVEFLQMINPEVAVISCGKNNVYGHPSRQVVDCLDDLGSDVYRSDEVGAIIVRGKR